MLISHEISDAIATHLSIAIIRRPSIALIQAQGVVRQWISLHWDVEVVELQLQTCGGMLVKFRVAQLSLNGLRGYASDRLCLRSIRSRARWIHARVLTLQCA